MPVSRFCGGSPVTSLPSMVMWPPVGCTKPAIILRVVVLPQPDGPNSTEKLAIRHIERHAATTA